MRGVESVSFLSWLILVFCSTAYTGKEKVGVLAGEYCAKKCDSSLNLACNQTKHKCYCIHSHPIDVPYNRHGSNATMCLKPAKLGEDCLHEQACLASDANADCHQMDLHNARCGCKLDYHELLEKSGNVRCVPETALLNSDLATLIGVGVGMVLFCGMTCLVLRIFARARFGPRHHHYGNAHLAPPITLSSEHGSVRRASNGSIRSGASGSRSNSFKNHQPRRPSDGSGKLSIAETPVGSPIGHKSHSPYKGSRSGSTGGV